MSPSTEAQENKHDSKDGKPRSGRPPPCGKRSSPEQRLAFDSGSRRRDRHGGRGSHRLSETTHPRPEIARFPAYLWTPMAIEAV